MEGAGISAEEYGRLSDQKAEDWRSISDVTPTLFGVAGAIFAAGATTASAWILMLSPVPLFFGVLHMIRNAKLQLQMITYLATHSPSEQAHWERDIAAVRPMVWNELATRGLLGRLVTETRLRDHGGLVNVVNELRRPSAWNTWLWIAAGTSGLVYAVAAINRYEGWEWAWAMLVLTLVFGCFAAKQAHEVEDERAVWAAAWEAHLHGRDISQAIAQQGR